MYFTYLPVNQPLEHVYFKSRSSKLHEFVIYLVNMQFRGAYLYQEMEALLQ